jgi:hypothetical protein
VVNNILSVLDHGEVHEPIKEPSRYQTEDENDAEVW